MRSIIFCPFTSHYSPQKFKLWKMYKIWRYYYTFTHVQHKWRRLYDVWFLRYKARFIVFCILGHFLPFDTLNNPKNQNLEKNENKTWRYYLFTLVYHKWQSCDVWFRDMEHNGQNILSFWTIFCPLTPPFSP